MDYGLLGGLAEGLKSGLSSYQDAQDRKRKFQTLDQQEKLGLLNAGAQKDPTTGDISYTPQMQAQKDLEAKKTELGMQEYDPNSNISQQTTSMANKFGLPLKTGTTSAETNAMLPAYEKLYGTKAKADEATARREDSNAYRTAVFGNKKDEQVQKHVAAMKDDLDPNKGRGGNLAKAQATRNSAERIEGLFQQFPDGNIPSSQSTELATSVAGLLNGGSAQSQHQIDLMTPSSLRGDVNKIAAWVTNNPRGNEQQAFMKMLHETTVREREIAIGQVKRAQISRLAAHEALRKSSPEDYNLVLNSYDITPEDIEKYAPTAAKKGLLGANAQRQAASTPEAVAQKPIPAAAHPEADQAIAWAKAHPNDPRSLDIMSRLGGSSNATAR